MPDLIGRPTRCRRRRNPNLKIIHIGTEMLLAKSNFQDFQRYAQVDLSIAGDAEATMPTLIEACEERNLGGATRHGLPRAGKS